MVCAPPHKSWINTNALSLTGNKVSVPSLEDFPCSFDKSSMTPLEQLPWLPKDAWHKLRTLGKAAFGKVLLVKRMTNQAAFSAVPDVFVVKTMDKELVRGAIGATESGANEIKAALALKSMDIPNLVQVYGALQDEKNFYLLLEYCDGGELFHLVQSLGGLDGDGTCREVIVKVLQALAALHRAGVAHRDVSLENVLLKSDGSISLIDFGQALQLRARDQPGEEGFVHRSKAGFSSKLFYRAPEVYDENPYFASKVDIFAVGVLLFVLIVGEYPFTAPYLPRKEEQDMDRCIYAGTLLKKHSKLIGPIDDKLVDFVERLLAPNPKMRPSAEEALEHAWCCRVHEKKPVGFITEVEVPQDEAQKKEGAYDRSIEVQ